jgi:hypothetical protein
MSPDTPIAQLRTSALLQPSHRLVQQLVAVGFIAMLAAPIVNYGVHSDKILAHRDAERGLANTSNSQVTAQQASPNGADQKVDEAVSETAEYLPPKDMAANSSRSETSRQKRKISSGRLPNTEIRDKSPVPSDYRSSSLATAHVEPKFWGFLNDKGMIVRMMVVWPGTIRFVP